MAFLVGSYSTSAPVAGGKAEAMFSLIVIFVILVRHFLCKSL